MVTENSPQDYAPNPSV